MPQTTLNPSPPKYASGDRVQLSHNQATENNVFRYATIKENHGNGRAIVNAIDSTTNEEKQFDVYTVNLCFYGLTSKTT